jgi:hypothetical protein
LTRDAKTVAASLPRECQRSQLDSVKSPGDPAIVKSTPAVFEYARVNFPPVCSKPRFHLEFSTVSSTPEAVSDIMTDATDKKNPPLHRAAGLKIFIF